MGSQDIRDAACGQPDELLLSAGVVADMVRRAAILVATVLAALTLSVDAVPDITTNQVQITFSCEGTQ